MEKKQQLPQRLIRQLDGVEEGLNKGLEEILPGLNREIVAAAYRLMQQAAAAESNLLSGYLASTDLPDNVVFDRDTKELKYEVSENGEELTVVEDSAST